MEKKDDRKNDEFTLPHSMKISDPFEFGEQTYSELIFKNRLTCKMVDHFPMDMDGITRADWVPVVRGMTGAPTLAIEMLSPKDFTEAMGVAMYFFLK